MRRLTAERGATAVLVAIVMTVLLGFVGLVVDVGAVYVERRELQNGADAAALALAIECAGAPDPCTSAGARPVAEELLDRNASDGESHLTGTRIDDDAGRVTVWARSKDAGTGALAVPMRFAGLFGVRRMVVRASATAGWGPPRSLPTAVDGTQHPSLPLTIDACEHDDATDGGVVYGRPVVIVFHQGGGGGSVVHPCATNASGQDAPGSFGWIDSTGTCTAGITETGEVGGQTGNHPPQSCSPDEVRLRVGSTIVLPIFESATGTGSHVTYDITGWAAFHLTGFKLHGDGGWAHPSSSPPCSGGDRCIAGWFVRMTDARAPVGGEPFGISVIGLAETPEDAVAPPDPTDDPDQGDDDTARDGATDETDDTTEEAT